MAASSVSDAQNRKGSPDNRRAERHDSAQVGRPDPTADPQWDHAVAALPRANSFFSAGWARVLKQSYGYQPLYVTLQRNGALAGCLPLMEVAPWPTGRRGVALPFTDESPPLAEDEEQARGLIERAIELGRDRGWGSFELRGGGELVAQAAQGAPLFLGHRIDLRKTREELLRSLDGSVRRGIRTAERSGVEVEFTGEAWGMRAYYSLHCLTRQRHGLPPQPWSFFKKIQEHLLAGGEGFVALARHGGRVVAGAVFLRFGTNAVYKYGASDLKHQGLRPNNLVMWASIGRLAGQGVTSLSLGRTSMGNEGLRRFKQGWGSADYAVWYLKYDYGKSAFVTVQDKADGWHNTVFRRLPLFLLKVTGRLIYRYCG